MSGRALSVPHVLAGVPHQTRQVITIPRILFFLHYSQGFLVVQIARIVLRTTLIPCPPARMSSTAPRAPLPMPVLRQHLRVDTDCLRTPVLSGSKSVAYRLLQDGRRSRASCRVAGSPRCLIFSIRTLTCVGYLQGRSLRRAPRSGLTWRKDIALFADMPFIFS